MRRTRTWGVVLGGVLLVGAVAGLRAVDRRGTGAPRPTVTVYKTPT